MLSTFPCRGEASVWQADCGARFRALYPVNVSQGVIAGVPVKNVTPLQMPAANRDKVLINLHGGGFDLDSGSLTKTVPIANLTQSSPSSIGLCPSIRFPRRWMTPSPSTANC